MAITTQLRASILAFVLVICGIMFLPVIPLEASELTVQTDFPNGSGTVRFIDQRTATIQLSPTEYAGRGWACWWYVKVAGIEPGETITLEVERAPWATPTRAAISLNNRDWRHTLPGRRQNGRMVYCVTVQARSAWFAWGPPFTLKDAEQIVKGASSPETARSIMLCSTRGGHSVPAIRFGSEGAGAYGIWIQARQHAWETGSSWVAAGLIDWLASGDPRAERLRENATITVVPIMDVDSVTLGAGGKDQVPQDHNRDWSEEPHWPSVTAAMEQIESLDSQRRFDLFIDLHNPGPGDSSPFFYITPRHQLPELGRRNLDRFLAASREEVTGPLRFEGEVRESGPDYDPNWRKISKNWVSFHTADHVVAVTLETSWNTENSSKGSYQTVGRQLGRAIERYFRFAPRE